MSPPLKTERLPFRSCCLFLTYSPPHRNSLFLSKTVIVRPRSRRLFFPKPCFRREPVPPFPLPYPLFFTCLNGTSTSKSPSCLCDTVVFPFLARNFPLISGSVFRGGDFFFFQIARSQGGELATLPFRISPPFPLRVHVRAS